MGSTVSRRMSEIAGVVCFAAAVLWFVALASYSPADPVWFFKSGTPGPPANFAGRVGAFLAELAYQLLGYAAYLVPVVLSVAGWHLFWCRAVDAVYTKLLGVALLLLCATAFLTLALRPWGESSDPFRPGGVVGQFLATELAEYLNRTGSIIFVLTLLFLALMLATQFSLSRFFAALGSELARRGRGLAARLRAWRAERQRARTRRELVKKHPERATPPSRPLPVGAASALNSAPSPTLGAPGRARPEPAPRQTRSVPAGRPAPRITPPPSPTPLDAPRLPLAEPPLKTPAERRKSGFTLPPLSLLDPPRTEREIDERELMDGARLLEEKCREFAVEGTVVQIHPGPVVTTFEFKPDAGVKYSKITSLADDLSLAMQAESVLIERLPGKSTVGIQIPNRQREQISLRELLESEEYRRSPSKLTLALGKTIHGEPFVTDLAAMPHLLLAGSTGTGKSVAINAMITSILYRATPDEVRFILIDPKRLELGIYEGLPHLMTPVVVDPKQAANALRWAVREMEERYKKLAAEGVRNLEQYNRNVRQLIESSSVRLGRDEDVPKPLPQIVLVIDELADLMMAASSDVEESITRLAQMARAVGIHMILATQRPSVDVITGLIKANLPARISFRVSSKVDSRTILDSNGAEQLLGRGDMLYLPPASARCIRLHGPYISEQETARLVAFLRKQGAPVYDETITADETPLDAPAVEKDDLYDEAARLVVSTGQASISYLQRRLRIGFSRAARLIDMMEAEGLISPAVGGKPREVLVRKDYFDRLDAPVK